MRLVRGLRIGKSEIEGHGCFAAARFRRHQRIAEYVGERITSAEAERRQSASGKKRVCDVDEEWSIDGSLGGNGTEYVNHSCAPNCYVVVSRGRLFIHALRDIAPAEEITLDYLYGLALDRTVCLCQATSCPNRAGLPEPSGPAL